MAHGTQAPDTRVTAEAHSQQSAEDGALSTVFLPLLWQLQGRFPAHAPETLPTAVDTVTATLIVSALYASIPFGAESLFLNLILAGRVVAGETRNSW
ncbi:hypothetical protein GCM10025762_38650 [Haloechinothrix salitolerans]